MRNRNFFAVDFLSLATIPFVVLFLRFEGVNWPAGYASMATAFALISLPIRLAVAHHFGLYRTLWRHAGVFELGRIVEAGLVIAAFDFTIGTLGLQWIPGKPDRMPFSSLILDGMLTLAILGAPRFGLRILHAKRRRVQREGIATVVLGAGEVGQLVARDALNATSPHHRIVAFLDDDEFKHGQLLSGIPVQGPPSQLAKVVRDHGVREAIIAMPSARGSVVRQILEETRRLGIEARTVPSLADLVSGKVAVTALRPIEIQDLLRREPIVTDSATIDGLVRSHTVLVTGAGGSIGAELSRQIAACHPSLLVLIDHSENQIFEINGELDRTLPTIPRVPVIADIRNAQRIREVLLRYRPFAVFHAAAHKHVPLMEENVVEAVTNNVLGTRNVVDAAIDAEVEHFVLISTDKAVRPTSVMGATKRLAEMVVRRAALRERRHYVAVRFGNVLGSRGSVVPTFLDQIVRGGPVTVTHPEMRRYFMTIPEAVQLVLQAGALGEGGELFVLDMGEPVKIVDLARDLIRLSGLEEGSDIEIRYTGLRPGEKLYEELLFGDEAIGQTAHPKVIRVLAEEPDPDIDTQINRLITLAQSTQGDDARLRDLVIQMVPDFQRSPAGAPVLPLRRDSAS